jgi:hypothetical protein
MTLSGIFELNGCSVQELGSEDARWISYMQVLQKHAAYDNS